MLLRLGKIVQPRLGEESSESGREDESVRDRAGGEVAFFEFSSVLLVSSILTIC